MVQVYSLKTTRGFFLIMTCRKKNSSFFQRFILLLILPVFLLLIGVGSANAGFTDGLFSTELPIEVSGESVVFDRDSQTYVAKGDVLLTQGTTTLKADAITVDMQKGRAVATGNVTITDDAGDIISGESISIDMNRKTAIIVKGRLFYKEASLTMGADEIRKTGAQTYELKKSMLTTCDCGPGPDGEKVPDWSIKARRIKLEVEDTVTAAHPVFYIRGVPVLYSPYMSLPANTRRKSGLLTPELGYSSLRGVKFDNELFWAISDSSDMTFELDIETKRGVGEGLEYRYVRSKYSFGEFNIYHFSERDIDRVREFRVDEANLLRPESAGSERYGFDFSHTERMGTGLVFKADIRLVSDDEYFIDFSNTDAAYGEGGDRSKESLESTASVTRNFDSYSFTTELRYFDNLLASDDDMVLQRLPVVKFGKTGRRIFRTPLFYSIETEFVNFERADGDRGQRLDVSPRLSLPMRPGRLFEFTPSITPRFTAYRVERETDPAITDSGSQTHGRALYEVKADLVTTLVRYYKGDKTQGSAPTFRHTVRPRLVYTFVPATDQSRLPVFDSADRFGPENSIRYSLNTTLAGKLSDSGVIHEYLYFDIGQSYDLREARGHKKVDPSGMEERSFGVIDGEVIVRPTVWSSASFKGKYDVYEDGFDEYDAKVTARHPARHELTMTYRYLRDMQEYFESRARLWVSESLNVGHVFRRSFERDETLEQGYLLGYSAKCWGAELSYKQRLEEDLVMLTFNLLGIGEVLSSRTVF